MIHWIDDFDTCEGRDVATPAVEETPDHGQNNVSPMTPGAPAMRLWTIWDYYQTRLIEGLA